MTLPDALHPDIQEEAFSDGVVPAVTFAAHAADKAVAGQQALVKRAGILPPLSECTINPSAWPAPCAEKFSKPPRAS
jgi:hypothetical protein